MRGPLALPNRWTRTIVRPVRHRDPQTWFAESLTEIVARIRRHCPQALYNVRIGIEDVPTLAGWATERVPLAAALEPEGDDPAHLIVYRRPLERRAASRDGLRILLHRTVVEQLSALTGLAAETIDPDLPEEEAD